MHEREQRALPGGFDVAALASPSKNNYSFFLIISQQMLDETPRLAEFSERFLSPGEDFR